MKVVIPTELVFHNHIMTVTKWYEILWNAWAYSKKHWTSCIDIWKQYYISIDYTEDLKWTWKRSVYIDITNKRWYLRTERNINDIIEILKYEWYVKK